MIIYGSRNQTKSDKTDANLTDQQVESLISIYERYRHAFSDAAVKVKNYQCKITFKEPVEFHKKSYPIAHSLKEVVRTEINRMMNNDIIEYSHSPYTLSLIHIQMCIRDRAKYWSESTQNIVRDNICNGKFDTIRGQTATAYFLGKVCLARNLEPRIPEECLVTKLAYHFEQGIARARPVSYTHLDVYKRQIL